MNKKHIDIEQLIKSDTIDKKELYDLLEKYSNNMNCDEYINNFKSVIQKNIQHTNNNNNSSIKKSNTNETCKDYNECFTKLSNTWDEIVKYTTDG